MTPPAPGGRLRVPPPLCPPRSLLNDPSASRWIVSADGRRRVRIAPRRDERPSDYAPHEQRRCPFCSGSEADTPPELDRIEGPDGWLARAVPNRYPAFESPDGEHEVIIESPRHACRFVDLSPDEATAAVQIWARRIAHWRADARYAYQLVFKNEGPAAGASLEHTHSQVVALPEAVSTPLPVASNGLVFDRGAHFLAEAASAPRFACESLVRPTDTTHDFVGLADDPLQAAELARRIVRTLNAVRSASGVAAYNLTVNAPADGSAWWIEITPRSAVTAGFELATGMWINATPPEVAAERIAEAASQLP